MGHYQSLNHAKKFMEVFIHDPADSDALILLKAVLNDHASVLPMLDPRKTSLMKKIANVLREGKWSSDVANCSEL